MGLRVPKREARRLGGWLLRRWGRCCGVRRPYGRQSNGRLEVIAPFPFQSDLLFSGTDRFEDRVALGYCLATFLTTVYKRHHLGRNRPVERIYARYGSPKASTKYCSSCDSRVAITPVR